MKDKLRDLIKSEGISATKLATILDIQPAGISHILAGRNKPSYDLICKIISRFPHVNPYWLLGDDPNMYNRQKMTAATEPSSPESAHSPLGNDLFGQHSVSDNSSAAHAHGNEHSHANADERTTTAPTRLFVHDETNIARTNGYNGAAADGRGDDLDADSASYAHEAGIDMPTQCLSTAKNNISKIVIFYNDSTFEIFGSRK